MKAEILTIGDEILIGQITNTNSVWIAQELNKIGIKVVHMASVADDEQAIINAFNQSLQRADFVFITGGLGPTKDDITKKTFSVYFDSPLEFDADVLNDVTTYFTKRGRDLSSINRNQALTPKGSTVIRNPNGTAPGMWMQKENTIFISMPGVPYEMKSMMTDSILPKINRENDLPHIYHKTVLTQGIGESALAELIETWEDDLINKNIKLAYLPQPGLVRLRLSSYGKNIDELKINIDNEIEKLQSIISQHIYGYELYGQDTPTFEKIISELLRERKKTISLAESCSGGYISYLLTSLAGASEIFKGGVVPYSNKAKHDLLNVDESIFTTVGVVSKACVEQLATNVLKKFNSDYSIAVSGIAGPTGGTSEKPVGMAWVAVASKEKCMAQQFQFGDNRQRNITMTAHAALNMLRKFILQDAM
jgi:nicotinamide-nucleotide amidase